MNKIKHFIFLFALVAFGQTAWAQFSGGDGTQANPYKINSTSDWTTLANNVNSGTTYSGVYFKVTDVIYPALTMIGNSEENSFQGIFDGNGQKIVFMKNAESDEYAAPFRYVKNATIKRVYIDATEVTYIASSGHYTGGLVGHSSGNTNISNCDIKIVVSGTAGEGYHGGIVGCVADGVTTIDNCLFGGTLTGSSTHCGGFVGWVEGNNDARVILNNCLFNPKQVAWGTTGSCTFVRSRYDSDVTLNNCYYTQTFGTAQGFSSAEGVNLGSGWVSNSTPDMSSYNLATATITGLPFWYDYTNSAITISYAVADADGTSLTEGTHYTAVIKDEDGTEVTEVIAKGTYTLTITGTGSYRGTTSATFHVGKLTGGTGTATDPYLIYSNADWNELAANVNSGTSYSGQYFKMTNDIRVTTSLGSNSDGDTFYSFNGTFDGAGHILHVTLNGSDDCVAPFTCINGATIKNLHITGSISTTGMRPASIASFVSGNSTITNCWSEVAISSSYNKDIDAGGFVARVNEGKTLTLNGCAFTGSITYSNENGYEGGGMVGFTQSGATATLNDCLFVPTAINITKYNTSGDNWKKHWMFVGGRKRGTYTNCYYNDVAAATSMVVENKQLRRIIPGENMAVTNANSGVFYNVSGIASYRPGMIYDAKLYAGSGEQVNLYMNYFGPMSPYQTVNYSASAGTLNGNVLTMPNADVVITATLTLTLEYEQLFTEQNRSFYKFNYPSTNAAGEPITLSSLLAFWKPSGQMSNGVNNSVLINSHYTITADAQCPTHITNTLSADFPDYMLLSMLLSGSHDYSYQDLISKSVVIMPDYEGYGISVGSTHPYLAEALTAQQVVDGARCGLLVYQELVNSGNAPQLADDWRSFSVGYSQGGAVALAVQRHIEQNDLSEELRFRGTLCGDGPYDLITTLRYYMEDHGTSYGVTTDHTAGLATLPVVLPMILKGMIDSDPAMAGYQLTDYLTTDFLATGIMDWLGSKTVTNKQIATAWLQQLNNGTTTVNGTAYPAPGTMSQMFSKHQVPTALGIGTEDVPWADLSKVFTQGFYNYLSDANNFNSVPTSPANAYQAMHRALAGNNVCTGWEPSHRIMFMHSQYDMVVPYGNYLAFRDAHPSGENDLYRVDNTFSDSDHQATGTEFLLYLYQRGSYFHWIDEGIIEWDGSGTEDDPWLISNVDEWLLLADRVKNGNSYSGKFFKMTDDIKVSSMVGYNTDHTFRGTFDGDGHTLTVNLSSYSEFCAPFAYTYGATIKNLITTGTITTSKQHAGGVVGRNGSSCLTLENVKSSVTINSSYNGDAQHGGLVGYAIKADLIGCAFVGRILGGNSKGCGGLLGYKTNESDVTKKVTITNCLFAPTNVTVSATNAYTLANNSSNGVVEISNCYYTQALGTVQGKQAHSITGAENVTVAFAGDATEYNASGLSTNGIGLAYLSTLYAGQDDNVSLNLTASDGYVIGTGAATYTPEGGTATEIVPVEGVYSFTMPDANVVINAPLIAGYTLDVTGYGDSDGGWVFIASPVLGSIAPDAVGNLLGGYVEATGKYDYDLYRFNQSPAFIENAYKEWENYHKHNTTENPFMLVNGQGYLYATKETKTLVFTGTFNEATEQEVSLVYETTNLDANMHGWNLVGNPFAETAYIADGREFYVMNDEGSDIILAERNYINAMEGIFVKADTDDETLTFTTTDSNPEPEGNNNSITLNLSYANRSCGVVDRAIIRFGEGHQLPKFQMRNNSTKLYIPQDDADYAVVNVGRDVARHVSTIPVNFKAKEDGQYTLSLGSENVAFSYLHLIDNMTGANVDLSATSSYTFTAKTADYASRFRLVFAPVCEDTDGDNGTFAFISNGNLIVNGTGTLQVIDLLGRQLTSQEIHSAFSILHSAFPSGVYVLRLINGNDVKTQKIVIE